MDEKNFFENDVVKVTNARFIVNSETYAMNGVTSVKSHVIPANRIGAIIGIIIGLTFLFVGEGGFRIFGIIIALIAGAILYNQKATHAVVLKSASGETQALSSQDKNYIDNVVSALNDALIHRG